MKNLTIRVPVDLHKRISHRAIDDDVSLQELVVTFLEIWGTHDRVLDGVIQAWKRTKSGENDGMAVEGQEQSKPQRKRESGA